MKTLIAFYSKTNTTKKVAHELRKKFDCDIEEIQNTQEKTGFWGWLLSGKEAFLKKSANISKLKHDPKKYDLVIIGGPVWAWNISSPVRKYCEKFSNQLTETETAFFCTMGGSGNKKAFQTMNKILNKKPISTLALTTKETIKEQWNSKIELFVDSIKVRL